MKDDTRNVVASNLTIAYFLSNPDQIKNPTIGNLTAIDRERNKKPEKRIMTVFCKFQCLLDESNK